MENHGYRISHGKGEALISVFLVPNKSKGTMTIFLMRLLSLLGSAFGVFIANAFGRFLGSLAKGEVLFTRTD